MSSTKDVELGGRRVVAAAVLIGPPASGKGTFAEAYSQVTGYPLVQPGVMFARLREEDSELGNLVRESLKNGGLCPPALVNKVVYEDALSKMAAGAQAVIIDGYPRDLVQFDFMLEHFDVRRYLHFDAPYELLLEACIARRICKTCSTVTSVRSSGEGLCKNCGEAFTVRWDDNADDYAKRYATYQKISEPILELVQGRENYRKWVTFGDGRSGVTEDLVRMCHTEEMGVG